MQRTTRFIILGLLMAGAASAVLYWQKPPAKPTIAAPTPSGTPHVLTPVMEKTLQGVVAGQSLKDSLSPEEYEALREDLKKSDPMSLERKILARNEELRKFRKLYLKVVKKSEEVTAYQTLLQDQRQMVEAVSQLNAEQPALDLENQVERMIYVDWLSEAIQASEKVAGSPIHEQVKQLVLSPMIFDQNKPEALRKSLYVDRMEVFRSYAHTYPEEAERLLGGVPESKYKKHLMDIINKSDS